MTAHEAGRGSRLADCRLIDFPVIADPRGNLTYVEGGNHVDFDLKRVFYLYDVPGGESRAGHALKRTTQVLIAMSGSFDVVIDDSRARRTVTLNRSYFGLYLPPLIWRELENFSSGAVCLVLASRIYSEHDYYRDYDAFVAAVSSPPDDTTAS
jgi:hypothetical protein